MVQVGYKVGSFLQSDIWKPHWKVKLYHAYPSLKVVQFLVQRLKPVFWNYIGIRHGGQFRATRASVNRRYDNRNKKVSTSFLWIFMHRSWKSKTLNGNFNINKYVTYDMLHIQCYTWIQFSVKFFTRQNSIFLHYWRIDSEKTCKCLEKERFPNNWIYRRVWTISSYRRSTSRNARRRKRKIQKTKSGFTLL